MEGFFIKNGNLKGCFALALVVFGLLGVYVSIKVLANIDKIFALVTLFFSFFMVVFGGISGRAKALDLKPFNDDETHR